jgi:DnaJ-class molecular chaperone
MKKSNSDISEQKCPACNGTGFPAVKRLAKPGRKIYPPPCKKCKGMGRIKVVAHRTGSRPLRKTSASHGLAAFR